MAKRKVNQVSIPQEVFEFVMTQLVLRSQGFKTTEMTPIITESGKNLTAIDLEIKRDDKIDYISLGIISLNLKIVLKNWATWVELASKEILENFKISKSEFSNLVAYKTMNILLKHLEDKGFELTSTEILSTFN